MKKIIIVLMALASIFMIGCSSTLTEEDVKNNCDELVEQLFDSVDYTIEEFKDLKPIEFSEDKYGDLVQTVYTKDGEAYYLNQAVKYYNELIQLSKDYSKSENEDIESAFSDSWTMMQGMLYSYTDKYKK